VSLLLLLGGSEQPVGSIEYTVEVWWKPTASETIIFGTSTFGEGDTFADPLAVDWDEADEVLNVTSIRLARGRDDNLSDFGMGEAQIVVEDTDGLYNPANEDSALYDALRPMQYIRVRAQVLPLSGSPLPIETVFEGLIRNIDYRRTPERGQATFTCGDLFLYFNRVVPLFVNQGRDTNTGEVLNTILDDLGLVESRRTIDQGDVIPSPGVSNPAGGSTALNLFQQLMQIARGDLYISRSGQFVFADRDQRAVEPASGEYANIATGATTTSDIDRVRNKATVIRETEIDNYASEWSDGISVANFGQQDFSAISSPLIYDQSQALALAQWLVSQRADPLVPFRSIEIAVNALSSAEKANAAIKTEIADRIVVTNSVLGQPAKAYYVEGIEHGITPSLHTISLRLLPLFVDSLVLDDAQRGRLNFEALAY
jgi:hypothetical protein